MDDKVILRIANNVAREVLAGKQEDILMDILKDSNLEQIANDLANQIMKPVMQYYKLAEKDPSKATKYLYKYSGKTLRPKKDFSLKKCMGDYVVEVDYRQSAKGLYLNIAEQHYMQIKVLEVGTMEWGYVGSRIKSLLASLKEEVADLVEHEMGHYYLEKAGDVAECIYLTQGVGKYFYDPQEMVLHGKVIFNKIKREHPDYKNYSRDRIERYVSWHVRDLPEDTNAPRKARFPKSLQKRYIKHIMKHYFEPVLQ
jgi:hypothetical protein